MGFVYQVNILPISSYQHQVDAIMKIVLFIFLIVFLKNTHASDTFEVVIDADFSYHKESSESIRKGMELALNKSKITKKIKIVKADHRGSTKRSKRNVRSFIENDKALFMVSGIHSPPLLANKEYINKNKVLTFVPWAAAAPITRAKTNNNWIYRLSIDDGKAGGFLSQYALAQNYKSPCLLLENTGWGKSNFKNMTKGFSAKGTKVKKTFWFNWGIQKNDATAIVLQAIKAKCDILLLVANSQEGALFVKTVANQQVVIPVLSHWGITGGDFHNLVSTKEREKVNLRFIQTKFNFLTSKRTKYSQNVLKSATSYFKDIDSAKDIKASTGFIHAYDLGLIIGKALEKVNWNSGIGEIRLQIKKNVEALGSPVQGLLKKYEKPFGPYKVGRKEAHEALDEDDFSIGKYDIDGNILNIN